MVFLGFGIKLTHCNTDMITSGGKMPVYAIALITVRLVIVKPRVRI